jgi:opacity protein-like surface antigen
MTTKLIVAALALMLAVPVVSTPAMAQSRHGGWHGGGHGWHGGGYRGGFGRGVGFGLGVGVGAGLAGGYYSNNYYAYQPDYDDEYVGVEASGDAQNDQYCASRYRSYDPRSGTFLGYDGQRHPCP